MKYVTLNDDSWSKQLFYQYDNNYQKVWLWKIETKTLCSDEVSISSYIRGKCTGNKHQKFVLKFKTFYFGLVYHQAGSNVLENNDEDCKGCFFDCQKISSNCETESWFYECYILTKTTNEHKMFSFSVFSISYSR